MNKIDEVLYRTESLETNVYYAGSVDINYENKQILSVHTALDVKEEDYCKYFSIELYTGIGRYYNFNCLQCPYCQDMDKCLELISRELNNE